ncbi:MAG: AAA family ATPase [Acidobacteria bacterium]|nr:AAA family ATPase [Acidobacteriota bacterium]
MMFQNPFRPGAGHPPPYLAGRDQETKEFHKLLRQTVILENLILTGLRGVGKTVLLDTFKPIAIQEGWKWSSTDFSESASVNEENLAIRLLTDLAVISSSIEISQKEIQQIGFTATAKVVRQTLNFEILQYLYKQTPGLVSDKLKFVLEFVWKHLQNTPCRGIIIAYDEAQNLSDQSAKEQYPLSMLLDVFQSIQKKGIPLMLVLTGLPTLFPKLVEARTFAERMFRIVTLTRLNESASREAIEKPIKDTNCPVTFTAESVNSIVDLSNGYPYFIQFICREAFDAFIQQTEREKTGQLPVDEILRKLDSDFFSGRWNRATDRQRELLSVISSLKNCDEEFTVQEIVDKSKSKSGKSFSSSHVNQMLSKLAEAGLVYKNRFGKYSFAVPLLGKFIQRQEKTA